jgi:hypothetical protein
MPAQTPIQVYGAWHCSNDYCSWATVRTVSAFDAANHWMIDRGDGQPSVNLVILSFVNPVKLMNLTTDPDTASGIPVVMTPAIVHYFTGKGVRVMFSIGGVSYISDWDTALSTNPTQLGLNAAAAAKKFGVAWRSTTNRIRTRTLPACRVSLLHTGLRYRTTLRGRIRLRG